MTDAEHIEAARKWIELMRATCSRHSRSVSELTRDGKFEDADFIDRRLREIERNRESLARVVELAELAPELLALIQEMHDYGQPNEHYSDNARGKAAWERAERMLERFRDEAWLMADCESESREVDDDGP